MSRLVLLLGLSLVLANLVTSQQGQLLLETLGLRGLNAPGTGADAVAPGLIQQLPGNPGPSIAPPAVTPAPSRGPL